MYAIEWSGMAMVVVVAAAAISAGYMGLQRETDGKRGGGNGRGWGEL